MICTSSFGNRAAISRAASASAARVVPVFLWFESRRALRESRARVRDRQQAAAAPPACCATGQPQHRQPRGSSLMVLATAPICCACASESMFTQISLIFPFSIRKMSMPLTSTLRAPCVPRITQRVATLLPSASSSSSVKCRSGNAPRSDATSFRNSAMPLTTAGGLRNTTSGAMIESIAAALPLLRISSKYRRAIALLSTRAGACARRRQQAATRRSISDGTQRLTSSSRLLSPLELRRGCLEQRLDRMLSQHRRTPRPTGDQRRSRNRDSSHSSSSSVTSIKRHRHRQIESPLFVVVGSDRPPTRRPVSPASSQASLSAACSTVSPGSTNPFGIFHFLRPLLRIRQTSMPSFFRRKGIDSSLLATAHRLDIL